MIAASCYAFENAYARVYDNKSTARFLYNLVRFLVNVLTKWGICGIMDRKYDKTRSGFFHG